MKAAAAKKARQDRINRILLEHGVRSQDELVEHLENLAGEILISAGASGSLVLARTLPGAAQYLGSAIDHAAWPAVIGTVAGDDSILIICRDPRGGEEITARLNALVTPAGR